MVKVFSFGGGVQSMAVLVLAAQGRLDYQTFLFCNVGEDSEHPATIEYVNRVAMPYAAENRLELFQIRRRKRDGTTPTLYQEVIDDRRTIDIPMYLASGMPGNRNCTKSYKVFVIDRWLKAHGATAESPATVALGISIDEYKRMTSAYDERYPFRRRVYPLIDMRLSRQDCVTIIERAGLPVPPKSSCWFCPFHVERDWQALQRDYPDLFDRAVAIEAHVNAKRATLGRDRMYLYWKLIPLDQVGQTAQMELDFDGGCESGYCMT